MKKIFLKYEVWVLLSLLFKIYKFEGKVEMVS